jgi:hypothetical protein
MYTEFEHKAIDHERRRDAHGFAERDQRSRINRRTADRIAGALERTGRWALHHAERIRDREAAQERYTRAGVSPVR